MRQEAARLPGSPPRERPHPSIRRGFRPKGGRAWLLTALLAAAVLAACGGEPPPDQDPAVPPPTESDAPPARTEAAPDEPAARPAASGRPAPLGAAQILLQRAAQLEHDGFWEDAAGARRLALIDATAADLPPDLLGEAHLAQIRLLLRLAQPSDAALALAQLQESGATVDEGRLALIRGRVRAANGDAEAALAAYDAYLEAAGPARHVALLERARVQTALGELDSALSDYSTLRDDPGTPARDLESALLEGGLLLENDARYAQADEWYVHLGLVSPWLSDDTFALHRSGAVRLAQDDLAGAGEAWTALLVEYPWHWRAAEAYAGLLAAGITLAPLVEGLYFYRQFRYDDARTIYTALLEGQPTAAEAGVATYYLAAIDEDLGDAAAAVRGYLAAAAIDLAGEQADNALWWAARLLELDGATGLARLTFQRLASEYPASPFAADAAFHAPLARYRVGDLQGAADGFRTLTDSLDGERSQRAWLWLGKSLDGAGDAADANAAFLAAVDRDPSSYYGLRARAHLDGAPLSPQLALGAIDASPIAANPSSEDWLATLTLAEPVEGERELAESRHWQAALDLWAAGPASAAEPRFRLALANLNGVWALYRAAQEFDSLGAVHLRLTAAAALLERVPADEQPFAPAEILRWAYPRGWPDLAATAARSFGVDELLLYALIRQESRFNPAAGSVAGALGLTQVIPTTGAEIARTLGDSGYEPTLLFRPERAIRYGASYLGTQLANFEQAAGIALAAYNGGPANAARWSEGAARDPDLFYEQISFGETRLYVKLVLENYAWYQYIYRGGAAPTIVAITWAGTSPPSAGG